MFSTILETVSNRIREQLGEDQKQLEVVFTPSHRILVEAPAGFGKTNTMVSKIAYMFASKQIPNPKKLLALTFSVNAAYKIKKDVNKQLPMLLHDTNLTVNVSEKIFVSNYHGFCRNILKKYGGQLHAALQSIDTLQSVDDSSQRAIQQLAKGLSYRDALFMSEYNAAIKRSDTEYIRNNFRGYNNIVIQSLLGQSLITYNAIITLTLKLFIDKPNVLKFYQNYYPSIFIDEYQDTNTLSYWLIKLLANGGTKLTVLGDSLQRIYGFIGAVPNLLEISQHEFGLEKIALTKNYRFATNPQMLLLDSNIRKNAQNPSNPEIDTDAEIDLIILKDQSEEAVEIIKKVTMLLESDPDARIAILVKQRGENVNLIIQAFEFNSIPFFYGLFTDEDKNYIQFHRICLFEFIELLKIKSSIGKKFAEDHLIKIVEYYKDGDDSIIQALINLLEIFWTRLFKDFSFLSNEEKIILVKDTLEHNSLKQYIEFVPSNVTISTIHAAKGLEWDYVIIPDMEEDSFPNWMGLCRDCNCKSDCRLILNDRNENKFLEELSVFYVAVTRAKKQVYFTASDKAAPDSSNIERVKKLSCFLKLKGVRIPIIIPNVSDGLLISSNGINPLL